jgi:hypothetical protein
MRHLVIASALLAALGPAATPAAHAVAAPPGSREADPRVKRHAYSFDSHASVTVYAISYQPGDCLYRAIHPDDYSNNWEWATKFDGVSDSTMGCQPG